VSDLRESILANLKKRFHKAGIRNYQSFVADLSTNLKFQISNFDLIICDAPCTGSGTWSRTPEQLYYFKKEKIDHYSNLQKSILENVVPLIRKRGHLLYITCSVFKKENEDVVEYLQKEFNLKVEKMELLKGYDKKADTLFAALLIA
jgi:16S rRNA (cytosine967-C5)-methyltransferase